jgi:hypothetical protein
MVEGQYPDDNFLLAPVQPGSVLDGVGYQIVVGEHGPFGQAGGAAGVFNSGDILAWVYMNFWWFGGAFGHNFPEG